MNDSVEIITVDGTNFEEYGFFCYKSKPKSQGYQKKLDWLRQRFAEGLRIKILYENGRSVGFIEYIPRPRAAASVRLWVQRRCQGKKVTWTVSPRRSKQKAGPLKMLILFSAS